MMERPSAGVALVDLAQEVVREAREVAHLALTCRQAFYPESQPTVPEEAQVTASGLAARLGRLLSEARTDLMQAKLDLIALGRDLEPLADEDRLGGAPSGRGSDERA